jgi:hypothetical protein
MIEILLLFLKEERERERDMPNEPNIYQVST